MWSVCLMEGVRRRTVVVYVYTSSSTFTAPTNILLLFTIRTTLYAFVPAFIILNLGRTFFCRVGSSSIFTHSLNKSKTLNTLIVVNFLILTNMKMVHIIIITVVIYRRNYIIITCYDVLVVTKKIYLLF
jgi:hypothetical protein